MYKIKKNSVFLIRNHKRYLLSLDRAKLRELYLEANVHSTAKGVTMKY